MALSVTEERHITQVSCESPCVEPAVLCGMRFLLVLREWKKEGVVGMMSSYRRM
jgi:hypothetical protein